MLLLGRSIQVILGVRGRILSEAGLCQSSDVIFSAVESNKKNPHCEEALSIQLCREHPALDSVSLQLLEVKFLYST